MHEILLEAANVAFRVAGGIAGVGLGLFVCFAMLLLAMRLSDKLF